LTTVFFLLSPPGMVENPRLKGEEKIKLVAMRRYNLGAHTKTDLKAHLVWVPKYRKRVLTGQVTLRLRDANKTAMYANIIPPLTRIFFLS